MRAPCILFIFVFAILRIFPYDINNIIDIHVNGSFHRSYNSRELNHLTYLVPTESGVEKGISLDEILPLMAEAHYLYVDSSLIREDDSLAEKLPHWYLVSDAQKGRWNLIIDGKLYKDVQSLEIRGELLLQDSLELWISWEGVPLLKEEIARFAQLHNISIKVVDVPKTQSKLIAVLRGKGKLPDVVMIQSDYLSTLTKARALQNLDYMDSSSLIEKGLNAFKLDGKIWGVPFYFDTQLLFYNRKLIPDDISPDWDLQDMENIARSIEKKHKEIIPIAWNAYSAYWLIPFQIGFGKEPLVEADGSIKINDTATTKALEYIIDLQEKGLFQALERNAMITLFTSGKVAMILSASYSIPLFIDLGLDFGAAPFPFNSETEKSISPLLDFKAFAITRKTHNPILSRRLIQYLTGIGVQQRFPIALSKLPAYPEAWQIMKEKNRHYNVLDKSLVTGTPVPPDKSYSIFKGTMWKIMRLALSGQMSVDEVLAQGQQIIDSKSDYK